MTRITESTEALHFNGEVKNCGVLLCFIDDYEGKKIIVCDKTCFHPEDYNGGDQPGDTGLIKIEDFGGVEIEDSITLPYDIEKGEPIRFDSKSQLYSAVRNNECTLLVGHIVKANYQLPSDTSALIGKNVDIEVSKTYRECLSAVHTGVHLMSYVLNDVMSSFWTREQQVKDEFGNPGFDSLAIDSSKIIINMAEDRFRLGKSLKKKGFDYVSFVNFDLCKLENDMNQKVEKMVADNKSQMVFMTGESIKLGSKRFWKSTLYDTKVQIPCGGTHVEKIGDVGKVTFKLSFDQQLRILQIETLIDRSDFYL